LLKKSNIIKIDRLEVCWPVLKIIVDNFEEFSNITGFHIEYDPRHHGLILKLADSFAHRMKYLSMSEAIVKYPDP